MRISESDLFPPKSKLPVGGKPADDAAYLEWRDNFLANIAERWVTLKWHEAINRPLALSAYRVDAYLFAALDDRPEPITPIYSHRLRFLATAYRDRPDQVVRLAREFANEAARS